MRHYVHNIFLSSVDTSRRLKRAKNIRLVHRSYLFFFSFPLFLYFYQVDQAVDQSCFYFRCERTTNIFFNILSYN